MVLKRDKWVRADDGLYYSKKPNRHGLILVAKFADAFEGYRILKTVPISELPDGLQRQIEVGIC